MTFTIKSPTVTCDACGAMNISNFRSELDRWTKTHPETCSAVVRR